MWPGRPRQSSSIIHVHHDGEIAVVTDDVPRLQYMKSAPIPSAASLHPSSPRARSARRARSSATFLVRDERPASRKNCTARAWLMYTPTSPATLPTFSSPPHQVIPVSFARDRHHPGRIGVPRSQRSTRPTEPSGQTFPRRALPPRRPPTSPEGSRILHRAPSPRRQCHHGAAYLILVNENLAAVPDPRPVGARHPTGSYKTTPIPSGATVAAPPPPHEQRRAQSH